jgi:NAD(P)-dependent dehydrogenase (short-subunit alcohol dehydrogenase family)
VRSLFDVSGKVVLVTGGTRGIGRMIAQGFVQNGARVYVSSRKPAACEQAARELSEFGTCVAIPADVACTEGWTAIVEGMTSHEGHIDVLVNNAGATWGAPLGEYPMSGWDKVYNLNVRGLFFLVQKALPLLRKSPFQPARIINIASINGLAPSDNDVFAYSSSKAAVIMLTRQLAKHLAKENILVNAVAPGPFQTDMMKQTLADRGDEYASRSPLGRLGKPEDIAGVAIFLAADASAYLTGAVIPCDGGLSQV